MKQSKSGITLVELIVSLSFVALIIAAGTAIYLIAINGFTGGTQNFNNSVHEQLFKKLLDTKLPLVSTVSFQEPGETCDSILYENGSVVYVQNHGAENELKYEMENAKSVTFQIDEVGGRCRFKYQIEFNGVSAGQPFAGSVMLLNITKEAFESENGVTLPYTYTISTVNTAPIYLIS